ncbi:SRPBCC family protein [Nocardioides gilvus]|uniref:SRPBCC family protein n=1 Tax=Nocardioides gilvus TaxID=1735589 RepID=UPI000D744457|nr:SRPBCC family protein [Nocardioides gilvus]
MTERISASRTIPATPEAIFAVLTDPDGHVAVDSSGMLQGVTGRPVGAVGEWFTGHMDRESLGDYPMGTYDVEVHITELSRPTAIAWTIDGELKPPIGHVYGYELEEIGPAMTRVTSYCDWSQAHPKWKPIFPVIDEKALRASLGLLERAVRRGYPRSSGDETAE